MLDGFRFKETLAAGILAITGCSGPSCEIVQERINRATLDAISATVQAYCKDGDQGALVTGTLECRRPVKKGDGSIRCQEGMEFNVETTNPADFP